MESVSGGPGISGNLEETALKKNEKNQLDLKACDLKIRKKTDITAVLACLLLSTGYGKAAVTAFPSLGSFCWILCGLCGLIALLTALSIYLPYGKWIWPGVLAGASLVMLVKKTACRNGLGIIGNDILTYLTGKTGKIYLHFSVEGNQGRYLVPALLFALLALLICALSYGRKRGILRLLFVLCTVGYSFELLQPDIALVLIAAGTVLQELGRYEAEEKKGKPILTGLGFLLPVGIALLPAIFLLVQQQDPLSFAQEQHQWKDTLHKLRYDSGTNAMPEGNLVNIGYFEKSEEEALRLKMDEPEKLYLRGLIGEVYTGSSWDCFDSSTYQENQDLFYWLHQEGFYGEAVLSQAEKLEDEAEEEKTLEITNLSACHAHLYLPYALADPALLDADAIGDDCTREQNATVKLSYFSGSLPKWYQTARWLTEHQTDEKVAAYLKKEESYRNFVYDADLQLTNSAVGVMERLFGQEEGKERSLSDILELVRNTLDQNLTYDESVSTYNGTNDFITYTLEQSKRGYSPHYATAATLMLRYLGVPARYVEGYYLSKEKAESLEDEKEVVLTEGDAHAWAEFYLDGVGWIPFEVTPGYTDEEEWEETGAVMADGLGEEAGGSFLQSSLTYTPPKQPEEDTSLPELKSMFRFEVKRFLYLIPLLMLLLMALAIWQVERRRLRLRRFQRRIQEEGNREAAEDLYGYAVMLRKRCGTPQEKEREEAAAINERVRFSRKEIREEERIFMETYAAATIRSCREQNGFWKHLRYHYILWLY